MAIIKPVIGSTGWGTVLNTALDDLAAQSDPATLSATIAAVNGQRFVAKEERARTFGALKTLETGLHNAFAHSVIAPDGNTLVAWRKGSNHTPSNGDIYIARYSPPGTVVTAPVKVLDDATLDFRDPCLLVLANGNILMTFFAYDPAGAGAPLVDGVRASVSTDNGITWSAPVVVDSAYAGGTAPFAAAAGPAVQLVGGEILVPTYGQTDGDAWQSSRISRSSDNGATWTDIGIIADEDDSPRHWQEPNIIATSTGLLAVIRTEGPSQTMWTATSIDGGVTWTGHAERFDGSGAPRLVEQAGFIYAIYRDIVSGRPTQRATADNGATWGAALELPNLAGASPAKPSMVYGNALAYGTDSLRYYYTLQTADELTADLVTVDAIVPEDRGYRGPAGTRLRKSGTQAVNTASWTVLTFDTEDFDTDAFHSSTTNPSRVSIPTGFSGYYQITGTVYMAASTAGQVQARVMKNGTAVPGLRAKINPTSGGDALVTVSGLIYLTGGGDYIELQAYQDSGGTVSARTEDTVLTVMMAAPTI